MSKSVLSVSNLKFLPAHIKMIRQAAQIEDELNQRRRAAWKSEYPRFESLILKEMMQYQEQIVTLLGVDKWKTLNEKEWAFDLLSDGPKSQFYQSTLNRLAFKKTALLKLSIYYLKGEFEEHYDQPFADIPDHIDGKMTIMEMDAERAALGELLK